ncbi:MAG: YggS family pyridoxal phosphate-dependent enzyme [Bacilli bacterium]|nr:YggS family pyridoxal phosphate-dependent enzyme [Bacilli bacterium]
MIKDSIKSILKELKNSKLIAVSKTKPVSDILEAYEAGVRDFGENHVQEILEKIDKLPNDIRWHMIGHLQTNKVKDIVDKVYLIHSVDTIKLAKEIDKQAKKKDLVVNILLELNIANEESKYGFKVEELDAAIKEIRLLSNVNVEGLMCVAPYTPTPEDNRKYFKEMYNLKNKYNLDILSMGMSNDYLIADEEHSTYVRIGTKIFGERDYSK